MESRKHRKTPITQVYPRPQWVDLQGRNQKLVMGYLVALTNKTRANNAYKEKRNQPIKDIWWGVRVSIKDIATFLSVSEKMSFRSARPQVHRILNELNRLGYILIYDEDKISPRTRASLRRGQYETHKAMEVLWDDRKEKRCFITPHSPHLSNKKSPYYIADQGDSGVTNYDARCNKFTPSGVTQVYHFPPSGVTNFMENVTPDIEEYGQAEPQKRDFKGASILIYNNILLKNTTPLQKHLVDVPSLLAQIQATTMREKTPAPGQDVSRETSPQPYNISQPEVPPAYAYQYPPGFKCLDNPAPLYSFWDTPGVSRYPQIIEAAKCLIGHIKDIYGVDVSYVFEAEHYRRLVCPDLRHDLPLEFGPLEVTNSVDPRLNYLNVRHAEDFFASRQNPDRADLVLSVISLLRFAPRGVPYFHDMGGYWYGPHVSMIHDYSGYMKSPKATESPFHRDASLAQLEAIVNNSIRFDHITGRQRFWLMSTTATVEVAFEHVLKRFKQDLLENPKSSRYTWYKKAIDRGDFGRINLLNWFKDYTLSHHQQNWYMPRMKGSNGGDLLRPGATALDEWGVYYNLRTQWGADREVFLNEMQNRVFEGYKKIAETKEIRQE